MSKTPLSPKGQAKKRLLLETGFTLFVKKGISEVSLEDILVESGIKKGNFYHYFKRKEQLIIESLIECYHKPFYDWFESNTKKKMNARGAIENYFLNAALHMEGIWKGIAKDPTLEARDVFQMTREAARKISTVEEEYRRYDDLVHAWILDLLKQEQSSGSISEKEDIDAVCDFIFSTCEGVYYRWIMNPTVDFKSAMQTVFQFIWRLIPVPEKP